MNKPLSNYQINKKVRIISDKLCEIFILKKVKSEQPYSKAKLVSNINDKYVFEIFIYNNPKPNTTKLISIGIVYNDNDQNLGNIYQFEHTLDFIINDIINIEELKYLKQKADRYNKIEQIKNILTNG